MSDAPSYSYYQRIFFDEVTRRAVFQMRTKPYWDTALGESGIEVMRRFEQDGLIERATIEQSLDAHFKKDQIKDFLKQRGLVSGGAKDEMIARLLAADPACAESLLEGCAYYRKTGEKISGYPYDYGDEDENDTAIIEAELLPLINEGKYKEAYAKLTAWDDEQEAHYGKERNVDSAWRAECAEDFVIMAQRVVAILPPEEAARFLVDWLVWKEDLFDQSAITQQHGIAYERDLMQWRRSPSSVAGIRIHSSPTNCRCSFAKYYDGRYRLEDAPVHPFGPVQPRAMLHLLVDFHL